MMFKAVRRQSGTLLIAASVALLATVAVVSGQDNPDMEAGDADPTPAPQPLVLHVHHHYYTNQGGEYQYTPAYRTYLGAGVFGNQNPVIQKYSQAFPVHAQTVVGGLVEPWKQNWGHLGFTAYLGQQGDKSNMRKLLRVWGNTFPFQPRAHNLASALGLTGNDFLERDWLD